MKRIGKREFKERIQVTKTELPPLADYTKYLKKIWQSSWVTNNGEFVQLLERKLESYLNVDRVVLVSNGTLALQLAIKALSLQGEIITTPFTFPATANVILWEGSTPVFADIDPKTFNLSPTDVERKITAKTVAILAVHVYGNPCSVEGLQKIADKYHLKIIYDAAHAFGVEYKKKSILLHGDISTVSFHAAKIFSTIEGGAIITKDAMIYKKLKLLRNFGIQSEEEILLPGINAKMNEFQAAMGLCSLSLIDKKIEKSQKIYEKYIKLLQGNPHIKFQQLVSSKYNYGYMPVVFQDKKMRDFIYETLIEHHVKPRKYFYPLITDFPYMRDSIQNHKTQVVRNADHISQRILCLPIYPSLDLTHIDRITDIINTNTYQF